VGNTAGFGFRPTGSLSCGNIKHEGFNIGPRDAGNRAPSEQRFDMALDAPAISGQRAALLRCSPTRYQSASFGVGRVQVT
jgi:hypothetical protein